ncbi:hypothetical protein LINGRAHAP2_LOCUS10922, partial [Linum grandiflorum]
TRRRKLPEFPHFQEYGTALFGALTLLWSTAAPNMIISFSLHIDTRSNMNSKPSFRALWPPLPRSSRSTSTVTQRHYPNSKFQSPAD